ncbi:MAG: Gfo/Idh/MocA family oxidoreductase [Actinomycetia bacterium]|nr:Gfo/Idh/MocA family oxidoreductase [Actinomycetes bacterium]
MGSWHAGNLAAQPGVDVVAVADVYEPSAAAVAEQTGASVMDAHAAIEAADAVLIASSDDTHAEFAIAAIEAGKWCLLEKPLGATLDQAQRVLDAEIASGRIHTRVGFMRELDPAHAQVAAAAAELGHLTRVRSVHRNVDGERREVGLLFAQSLIHDIHTIRWLSGREFARVTVHVAERPDGFRDVLLVGGLVGGGLGVIDFEDQAFAYEVQVEVTGELGMAATVPHPRAIIRSQATESMIVGTDWFARFQDAYRLEIEQWCADLAVGVSSGPTVWDGFAAQVVAAAGEQAMLAGQPVEVVLPARPSIYERTPDPIREDQP